MADKIDIDATVRDTKAGLYTSMNKNQPLIDFEFVQLEDLHGFQMIEKTVYSRPWFIPDLMEWARKRHAPKHRANIEELLNLLGLTDIKSIIDFSKALSLPDTLWINFNDKYDWEAVNLFDNPFDETIARIAFDGGIHGRALSTIKQTMMIPLSICVTKYDYESIAAYCMNNNMLQDLYQMVIFDYLVTNDDRHLNNVGVLLDADDFTVKGLAPIFDNGAGLLAYVVKDNLKNYTAACEYASGKGPCFYDNF